MSPKKTPEAKQPKKISRSDADRLNNFAQGLDDEVTHVVDYGDLGDLSSAGESDTDE
jgi:hypothetical protein